MSLNESDTQTHCENIRKCARARNKIVILCEGKFQHFNKNPSPQTYSKMEEMPDANFYKACVPKWWRQHRPEFFICGDRKDVLNIFFTLLKLHHQPNDVSFLNPDKLFAIVDLDIQKANICSSYNFDDTEKIFRDLYNELKVNQSTSFLHRIWVTGLIHKEAYFLTPDIQPIFENHSNLPHYNNHCLRLEQIYMHMIGEICQDIDLQNNWQSASQRIQHCSYLNFDEIENFKESWNFTYQNTGDELKKKQMILALLTIVKSKKYWENVKPPDDWNGGNERKFREQLSLKIGEFYSCQSSTTENHIPFFFRTLYDIVYKS